MNNIQFDSFQKYLVSIGTILLIAPLFAFQYLLSGAYDVIISSEEYDNLSDVSLNLLSVRVKYLDSALKYGPYICLLLMLLGLVLIILGCIRWYKIQILIDDNLKYDHDTKKLELEKQTQPEIFSNIIEEIIETDSPNKSVQTQTEQYITPSTDRVRKYIDIEQRVYNYLSNTLDSKYKISQNMKANSYRYDIVAESNTDTIIYEIKYWKQRPPFRVYETLEKLKNSVESQNSIHHNFVFKLIIVSPSSDFINRFKSEDRLNIADNNIIYLLESDI
mgnify:FL=1